MVDSNWNRPWPANFYLNSQDVLPTVVIDSLADLEVIEGGGPVTPMAGKGSQISEFEGH